MMSIRKASLLAPSVAVVAATAVGTPALAQSDDDREIEEIFVLGEP